MAYFSWYLIGSLLVGLLPKCILKFAISIDMARKAETLTNEGEKYGKMPLRRMQVYVVGESGAGKTSLCKRLMAEKVDPEEQPSVGYPTKTCTMWNKNDSWTCWTAAKKSCESHFYDVLNRYILQQTLASDEYKVFSGTYSAKDCMFLLFASLPVLSVIAGIFVFEVNGTCISESFKLSNNDLKQEKNIVPFLFSVSSVALLFLYVRFFGCLFGILCPLWTFEMYGTMFVILSNHHTISLDVTTSLFFVAVAFSMSIFMGIGKRTMYYAGCGFTLAPPLLVMSNSSLEICYTIPNLRLIQSIIALISISALFSLLACMKLQTKGKEWVWGYFAISLAVQTCHFSDISAVYKIGTYGVFLGVMINLAVIFGQQLPRIPDKWRPYAYSTALLGPSLIGLVILSLTIEYGQYFINHSIAIISLFSFFIYVSTYKNAYNPHWKYVDNLLDSISSLVDSNLLYPEAPFVLHICELTDKYVHNSVFVPSGALHLLVFDMKPFSEEINREKEFTKISSWLHNMYTHQKSYVLIIGTDTENMKETVLQEVQDFLKNKITNLALSVQALIVWNAENPIFTISNLEDGNSQDNLSEIKCAIWETVEGSESAVKEHPIKWLKFLTFVEDRRTKAYTSDSLSSLLVTLADVEAYADNRDELIQMLTYFNETGEIIYDQSTDLNTNYVVLDYKLLFSIVDKICRSLEKNKQGRWTPFCKLLEEKGILRFPLARFFLNSLGFKGDETVNVLLSVLETRHILCQTSLEDSLVRYGLWKSIDGAYVTFSLKLKRLWSTLTNVEDYPQCEAPCKEDTDVYTYLVASKLPHISGNPIIPADLKTIEIFFDFGNFMPDAFFSFVLARCQNHSKLQFQTDEQTYIYQEGGFFVGDNSFGSSCYWLHREIIETNAALKN